MNRRVTLRTVRNAVAFAAAAVCISALSAVAGDAPPMRIAFPSGMNGQIVVTMDKAGIAKKNGLDATFMPFQYGPPMMEALAARLRRRRRHQSHAGDLLFLEGAGRRQDRRHARQLEPLADGGQGQPDQDRQADLAGHNLGVSFRSDSHLDTLICVKEQGLKDKVKLINISPAELATALQE